MHVHLGLLWLVAVMPALRVAGTVTDTAGNPLSRRVILYDSAHTAIAETQSGADGAFAFELSGANFNDRFVARAVGQVGECDDISCPMRGEVIQ